MQFEIYLLEIIKEVYFRMAFDYDKLRKSAEEHLDAKIKAMNDGTYTFRFAEFDCRRRLSREWEDVVVRRFVTETKNCVGTSNVYLAMRCAGAINYSNMFYRYSTADILLIFKNAV